VSSQDLDRQPGLSVRLKLTLSYAGFLMLAGALLLAAVWLFLLRDVPVRMLLPDLSRLPRALDPTNFGPAAFGPAVIVVLGFLLAFGLVGGWFLAGRMLAPLVRITDATRTAAAGSLAHRIHLPGRQDEFRELSDSFDAMLARLEAHVAEQQRFAANASHELRTPLAITRSLLDVARDDPDRNPAELVERLRTVNARAIDLTEALLVLSRADQGSFTREAVDLSLVAEEATETLLLFAEQRGVTLETAGDVTPAFGSPALLLQLATNLVHNAIVHNLPDHGKVRVSTATGPGFARLTVENTGEQLSADLVSTFTERFQRGGQRVRTDRTGVGLGLAIVQSIVEAHDGTLDLTPVDTGGLRVAVQLPTWQAARIRPRPRTRGRQVGRESGPEVSCPDRQLPNRASW
jgi:two-component system sensor histidine kinase VanS